VSDEVVARSITEFAVLEALYLAVLYADPDTRLRKIEAFN